MTSLISRGTLLKLLYLKPVNMQLGHKGKGKLSTEGFKKLKKPAKINETLKGFFICLFVFTIDLINFLILLRFVSYVIPVKTLGIPTLEVSSRGIHIIVVFASYSPERLYMPILKII